MTDHLIKSEAKVVKTRASDPIKIIAVKSFLFLLVISFVCRL